MVNLISKFSNLNASCSDIHVWGENCMQIALEAYSSAFIKSLQTYSSVYLIGLLLRRRIPTKEVVKKTVYEALRSSAFLSTNVFGIFLFFCASRKVLGHFNILTIAALPTFLASLFAILIERPSRRTLLSLYVGNLATETLWNISESRHLVRSIQYGEVAIFSASIAVLFWFYKSGYHKIISNDGREDIVFSILRFVIGENEKTASLKESLNGNLGGQEINGNHIPNGKLKKPLSSPSDHVIVSIAAQMRGFYLKIVNKIKSYGRAAACLHSDSCLHYSAQGTAKMFTIGLGVPLILRMVLNIRRILQNPKMIKSIIFKDGFMNLALFLGGFTAVLRGSMCTLRRITGHDSPALALPAGLLAGVGFVKYPDTTIALYVLWKVAQVLYNLGIYKGYLPKVPGFTEFLYSLGAAVIIHAAFLEPKAIRSNYWKFMCTISGNRVACINRLPLDVWGLGSSEQLEYVLQQTKTVKSMCC